MNSWKVDEIMRRIEELDAEDLQELKKVVSLYFGWMPLGNIILDTSKLGQKEAQHD